jgi:RNA polymerase sigma-70 factor (ECF subfamily)
MENPQLLQLIELAQKKNQKAQSKLINEFWQDVFSFVLKKIQDKNIADEITVSVFSKVLAKLDLYDKNFKFKTWILTIAQNTVIDFWRKKERENEQAVDDLQKIKNEFARSPEELMISKQEQEKIINILATMDFHYQKIIELRFFEEKSIKEISEELNISTTNTKVRIMRAKKILSQLLKNPNETE